jgi:hypothetical protein
MAVEPVVAPVEVMEEGVVTEAGVEVETDMLVP